MVVSRNGREGLELNASQDGGRVLAPARARLETRRGRLKMWVSSVTVRCARVSRNKWGGPIS
eukprot:513406-Prymnesium_polylepis.1